MPSHHGQQGAGTTDNCTRRLVPRAALIELSIRVVETKPPDIAKLRMWSHSSRFEPSVFAILKVHQAPAALHHMNKKVRWNALRVGPGSLQFVRRQTQQWPLQKFLSWLQSPTRQLDETQVQVGCELSLNCCVRIRSSSNRPWMPVHQFEITCKWFFVHAGVVGSISPSPSQKPEGLAKFSRSCNTSWISGCSLDHRFLNPLNSMF